MPGNSKSRRYIGWACAYTPLVLMDAAGFSPCRVLPMGNPPDQAGRLLHETLCPHVKILLDRAMSADLPPLEGMVFTTSCDAMRRLADAWKPARPQDRVFLLDLPTDRGDWARRYLASELRRLADALALWGGEQVTGQRLRRSARQRAELGSLLHELARLRATGRLHGSAAVLQRLNNQAATLPLEEATDVLRSAAAELRQEPDGGTDVPIYLFGNVLPDPDTFALIEDCGARIVDDDLCTGSRWLTTTHFSAAGDAFQELAAALLHRPPCARTVTCSEPVAMARELVRRARACGARGVVCHTLKFCDPYLARLPAIRQALRDEGVPLLVIEGDCSLRTLGQQRTRIQAFVEMLV